MANTTLNSLLKEYEQKKYKAELDYEKQKKEFYNSNPKLAELNQKLGQIAINISKAVLNNNAELEKKLRADFDNLQKEKDNLLKKLDMPARRERAYI